LKLIACESSFVLSRHDQTRRSATATSGQYYQPLRGERLRAACDEADHPQQGAAPRTLPAPERRAVLWQDHELHVFWARCCNGNILFACIPLSSLTTHPFVSIMNTHQVWEGKDIVTATRALLGATNPLNSAPGTIRGDLAVCTGRNVCHGSDSIESAQKEIELWFPEGLNEYCSHSIDWIND